MINCIKIVRPGLRHRKQLYAVAYYWVEDDTWEKGSTKKGGSGCSLVYTA